MSEQTRPKSTEDTEVAESTKNSAMKDSEAETIVGGTTAQQFDKWHNLPSGSGSGFGE